MLSTRPVSDLRASELGPHRFWWQRWDLRTEDIPKKVTYRTHSELVREGPFDQLRRTTGTRPSRLLRIRPYAYPKDILSIPTSVVVLHSNRAEAASEPSFTSIPTSVAELHFPGLRPHRNILDWTGLRP